MNKESLDQFFARHQNQSGIIADEHIRRLTIALGESVAKRRKLYLDSRYWIFLRDAALGRSRRADQRLDRIAGLREERERAQTIRPLKT